MAVNRLWLFNAPSGDINGLQMSQIAIGYPFVLSAPIVPTEIDFYSQYGNITTSYSQYGNITTSYGKTQDASHMRLP